MTQLQRVLIVDDDADQRDSLAAVIANEGVRMIPHSSPVRALQFLRTAEPCELVFSDIAMSEMCGLEFAREVRRVRPEIPIILLTGHDAVVDGALADGYFALLKPVAPDVLASVLNERLNRG